MSYILDALRRADAEREREAGGVPTLQSQARAAFPDDDDALPVSARPAWLLPAAGGALLALAAAWLLLRGGGDTPAVAPVPVAAAPQPPVADPVAPSVAPAPAPVPARPEPLAALPAAAAARPAVPAAGPRQMPERSAPVTARVPPAPPPAAAVTRPAAAPAPQPLRLDRAATQVPETGRPAAATPVPERIPRLSELPEAQRRGLPALAIGGSVNSPDPNARMVILNGQVQREGDTVGDGLVLKRIRASSAVFEYRGQIFEMPF